MDIEAECAGPVYEKDLRICGWWPLGWRGGFLEASPAPTPDTERGLLFRSPVDPACQDI